MPRPAQDVTDTELAMLQVLWDKGSATRRQITDALYPNGGPAHYTTVQKLMERLERKGYVKHQRSDGVLTYTSTVGREQLISRRLQEMAEKLCGGSLTPLFMNLVRAKPLTARELDEFQGIIRELRQQAKPKGKSS
jgi:BlaI family transcriptional regulator, penicillinase repressor